MVSKSTSILMAVAVVAVAAVAIIGLGYAYTASTDNTGNTSVAKYITLDTGNDAADFTGAFNGGVKFNTVTSASGTTYTFDTAQLVTIIDEDGTANDVSAVELGEVTVNVTKSNGNTDNFKFSVANTSATAAMKGTFYIGISIDGGSSYVVRQFTTTQNTQNFYQTISEGSHAAATAIGNATAFTASTVMVKMYVSAMDAPAGPVDVVVPLNSVTFQFKAEVPQA